MTYDNALQALSDPTRRAVFESLRNAPKAVSEIARTQPVSRPAVSQHLKVLETAGLVKATASGNRRIYSVRAEGLEPLKAYIESFWGDALTAFAHHRETKSKEE